MSSQAGRSVVPEQQDRRHKSWWKRHRMHRKLVRLFLFLVALVALNSTLSRVADYWDVGSDSWFGRFKGSDAAWRLQRGAVIMDHPNQFGDQYSSVRYLWQGWSPADSLWFYNTSQGSDLIPYDFFMALEVPETGKLFSSNDNLYYYGYLPQSRTRNDPDALPVGFVKDTYAGKDYLGFTCAACHTGQVNYKGVAMRIDGAPAGSDMDSFLQKMSEAMRVTEQDPAVHARFVKRVLDRGGDYSSEEAVNKDLENFSRRLAMYIVVNRSPTRYGYYRLDAFGRIYNRVLEHIVTQDQLNEAMGDLVREGKLTQAELDALRQDKKTSILTGEQRDHLVFRLAQVLPLKAQLELRNKLFNTPDAPVSYPYMWDVPQHDYVQWNAIVPNAGLGPIGRNAGEVIGVFATLDWSEKKSGFSLAALISGQGFFGPHIDYKSSINVHNLRLIESRLGSLHSPKWPTDILPGIDPNRVHRGEALFSKFCASCHTNIDPTSEQRRVVASITSLKNVRTDPKMAVNAATYDGLSGILQNQYTNSGAGPVLINQRAPVAALLTKATLSVVATPNTNKGLVKGFLDWADDLVTSFFHNEIKPSIRQGNYDPDTTANPYASLMSYKARALNGIWATAPYLHNGSVPTLYDLLLPPNPEDAKNPSAGVECKPVPPGMEYRPCKFMVGSREFDPEKVGLKSAGYDGFVFNTKLPGNSNAGHEYGTKVFNKEDRLDLLEYLKTL
jgi:hypothetical protein